MGPDWAQCRPKQSHLVECVQEQDVHGATPIDKESVELYILDDRANNGRVPPWLCHKTGWSLGLRVMGTSYHLRYSGVAGETTMTSRAFSF
jgi:hypothetical protein